MPVMTGPDLLKFLAESFPQAAHLQLQIEHVDSRSIRLRLPVDERHQRPGGNRLRPDPDVAGGLRHLAADPGPDRPVTPAVATNLNMNFLRRGEAARGLIGQGRLLKLGARLAVAEFTILSDGSDDPIAHATLTYSIPPRREPVGYGVK